MTAATLIPGHEYFVPRTFRASNLASVDGSTTGDKTFFRPNMPIAVIRWGLINADSAAIVCTGTGAIYNLDLRTTAGSDTAGRSTISTITTGIVVAATGIGIGKGVYSDFNIANFDGKSTGVDGSLVNAAPSGLKATVPVPELLVPGNELVFKVATAPQTSGGAATVFFVHYYELPFTAGNSDDKYLSGTNSLIGNLTKLAS